MNLLLIYPNFPDTFWSFTYALSFIEKKTARADALIQLIRRKVITGKNITT
jgi:hypothetical protein